jgi:PAP2 superfamily
VARGITAAQGSRRAAVFDLCPRFLLLVIAALLVAEANAALFGLTAPHQSLSFVSVGLAACVIAIAFAVVARPRTTQDWAWVVAASLILPLGNTVMPYATGQTIRLLPHVYDEQVAALDRTLGFAPAFVFASVFKLLPSAVTSTLWIIYASLLLPVATAAALEAHRARRMGLGALPTFLVIAIVGYAIYMVLPVIGPDAYYGAVFPNDIGLAELPAPRTGMPSLHTAWVVMAFLATCGMHPAIRVAFGLWCIAMMAATLGYGEHYLTDLVGAVPFVLLLRALCAIDVPWTARARWASFAVAGGLLFVWGLAVRDMLRLTGVPGLVPGFMIGTVAMSLLWERRLARAQGLLRSVPLRDREVWRAV